MNEFFALHGFAGSPDQFSRLKPYLNDCEIESPWLLGHGPEPWLLKAAQSANSDLRYQEVYAAEGERLKAKLKPKKQGQVRYL